MFKKLIAVAMLIVVPSIAHAADKKKSRWNGAYIVVGGGGTISGKKVQVANSATATEDSVTTLSNTFDKRKISSRTVMRAEIGASFGGDFRLGLEVNFLPETRISFQDSADSSRKVSGKVRSRAGFANFYYDLRGIDKSATPYIGIGVGMTRNNLLDLQRNWTVTTSTTAPVINGTETYTKKFSNGFAWKAIAGLKISMSDMLYVDVAYSYANIGRLRSDLVYSSTGGTPTSGTRTLFSKANLREHMGTISLGLQF